MDAGKDDAPASAAPSADSSTVASDGASSVTAEAAGGPADGSGKAVTPAEQAQADALKDKGNAEFAAGQYTHAVDHYTAAIELAPSAVLFCNRAFAQLKIENYGSAIADAEAAMKLDPGNPKAAYRRGSALMALSRYKLAKRDFAAVAKARPADKDAAAKLAECERAIKRAAFEAAIATEASKPPSETLDPSSLAVAPDYDGPVLPPLPDSGGGASAEECAADPHAVNAHGLSLAFVRQLRDHFAAQKRLHKRYCWQLLIRLKALLKGYKALVHAAFPSDAPTFNVCGDTHGQYYDTLKAFELCGEPGPRNPYLFNGDFVDRGSFSVENVLLLFAWKLLFPDHFHLTRGNHETKNMNSVYGFTGEVAAKFDAPTMTLFTEVFQALPLACCIDRRVFVTHGGLFQSDGVKLADIEKVDRFREPPEGGGLMSDMLWSDPQPFQGRGPSKRGVGQSFGPDITAAFLADNGLELLIRSHEVKDEGYVVEHAGKCITVFTAPNYCDSVGNKGAVCRLARGPGGSLASPTFTVFKESPHPPVRPMAYAGGMGAMFGL